MIKMLRRLIKLIDMKTLVIYDITEDDKRTKLLNHLRDYGLNHIQYSGFLGEVNPHDRHVLTREVEKYLSTENDSVYIIPLCDKCVKVCQIVSKTPMDMKEDTVKIVE